MYSGNSASMVIDSSTVQISLLSEMLKRYIPKERCKSFKPAVGKIEIHFMRQRQGRGKKDGSTCGAHCIHQGRPCLHDRFHIAASALPSLLYLFTSSPNPLGFRALGKYLHCNSYWDYFSVFFFTVLLPWYSKYLTLGKCPINDGSAIKAVKLS